MNKTILLASLALGGSVLLSGCAGTGPDTQTGAVAGGALGALTGAIIGNNSGGHNALGGAVIGGVVGAIAGGTIGNTMDHENGTIYAGTTPPPPPRHVVYVQAIPPQPQPITEAIPPSPAPNAVWVGGYWLWSFDNSSYTWTRGQWMIPPPNARAFHVAHWEYTGGYGYRYVPSYWELY